MLLVPCRVARTRITLEMPHTGLVPLSYMKLVLARVLLGNVSQYCNFEFSNQELSMYVLYVCTVHIISRIRTETFAITKRPLLSVGIRTYLALDLVLDYYTGLTRLILGILSEDTWIPE